jgi:hypothetical protein
MSKHYTKRDRRIGIEFRPSTKATAHGGQMAINAVAGEFGLWDRVRNEPRLDPRRHKGKGFDPVVYVTALLFSFTSGGDSLADAERLEDDESLKMLLGVKKLPDQSAIGEWLRNVGEEGAEALRGIIRDFCAWAVQKADRDRLLLGGELEWVFDDTQIEVNGKKFEGAAINYNGDLALSWQTLWAGPFICDAVLGTPADHKFAPESCTHGKDVSAWMPEMLERCAPLGKGFTSHLYADSASSAGHYLECLEKKFAHYSVSYNKWTGPLEGKAAELPKAVWSKAEAVRWRDGKEHTVQHAMFRYQPGGCKTPKTFAALRHRRDGDLFWRHCFVVHDGKRQGADPKLVFEKHRLKGDYERRFSELLTDLGLHRPPCQNLAANNVYYLLGVLAFDLLQAIKLLYLPEGHQPKRVRTLLHQLLLIPVETKRHARQLKAVCFIGAGWIEWWKGILRDLVPHYHLLGTG